MLMNCLHVWDDGLVHKAHFLHVCDVGLVCRDGNCELFVGMGFWNRCVGVIRLLFSFGTLYMVGVWFG